MLISLKSKLLFLVAIISLFIGCSRNGAGIMKEPSLDKYGGLTDISGNNQSGFFRTQLINNRWLFVDPDNHPFFSLGINHVSFYGDESPLLGFAEYPHNLLSLFPSYFSQYATEQWVQEVINRYKELGFNTLGAWSDNGLTTFQDEIPYTVILGFASSVEGGFGSDNCPSVSNGFSSDFPDVYDPRFKKDAYTYAQQAIMPGFMNDPWLVGYFIDNELSWFGGAQLIYNPAHTLADDFIALPSTYAGKQYWVNTFLQQKLGYSLDMLNQLYGTTFTRWSQLLDITGLPDDSSHPQIQLDKQAFLYDIALTYFSVTNAAIKSVDPNHLNLCARFASYAPDQVVEAASQYCDVISVNDYYALDNSLSNIVLGDPVKRWEHMLWLSTIFNPYYGKPFMQSEFGTRAEDSGLPNLDGAGWSVKTQNDRGQFYREDINRLLSLKINGITFLAGFHWFEWSDEPATGRFDGENSNYGFVNIKDELYETFFNSIINTTTMLFAQLADINNPALNSPDFITSTSGNNGGIVLGWDAVKGADSYTVILSPYRSMPERFTLRFNNIYETSFTIPYNLPQGRWWFSVKADGLNNIQSDFTTVTGFDITAPDNSAVSCMSMNNLSCFTNNIADTFPQPDNSIGSAVILPSTNIRDIGTQSGRISFTLNSLSLLVALNSLTEVTLSMNQSIPTTGFNTLSFDVYPEAVYTPSGRYRSATDFVNVRLTNNGVVFYDSALPQSLPAFQWSTISIPITGTYVLVSFYVNKNTSDIPYDQRITFYLDNMNLTQKIR